MITRDFWQGKRVFVTGHTGFKGSWLCLWLQDMGAIVQGYALAPPTRPSLFIESRLGDRIASEEGDVRDLAHLYKSMSQFKPEIVFHMAAQPLVRLSYESPVETYSTNVMGTVSLFEAVRTVGNVKSVVNVTSDKCYENQEWLWGYRESEPMGGFDPYSSSKGCAELVTASYRRSFFNPEKYHQHGCALASARAGNVVGGGDWALDRLVPDVLKAFASKQTVTIRNPNAIRPWQHVLEPLSGYLTLAEKLYSEGPLFAEGWNFGPKEDSAQSVKWILDCLKSYWGDEVSWQFDDAESLHEANFLKLDCSKAKMQLGWQPQWGLEYTLHRTVNWHKAWLQGADMYDYTITEINDYMTSQGDL
jgi:CDP-glucose 4,6-dehydratase